MYAAKIIFWNGGVGQCVSGWSLICTRKRIGPRTILRYATVDIMSQGCSIMDIDHLMLHNKE